MQEDAARACGRGKRVPLRAAGNGKEHGGEMGGANSGHEEIFQLPPEPVHAAGRAFRAGEHSGARKGNARNPHGRIHARLGDCVLRRNLEGRACDTQHAPHNLQREDIQERKQNGQRAAEAPHVSVERIPGRGLRA